MELTESIFYILEILGTVAFAVSGAMIAVERGLDLFGVLFLGVITAVGGGAIRDIMMGAIPPAMFVNREYVFIAIGTAAILFATAYFGRHVYFDNTKRLDTVNNIFDAIGLGAFAVSGADAAISAGFGSNAFMCIFLGMFTGIGGGLLRDMMSRSVPVIFRKRIYAIAAIVGAGSYYCLYRFGAGDGVSIFTAVGITLVIRILATVFKWDLPVARAEKEALGKRK